MQWWFSKICVVRLRRYGEGVYFKNPEISEVNINHFHTIHIRVDSPTQRLSVLVFPMVWLSFLFITIKELDAYQQWNFRRWPPTGIQLLSSSLVSYWEIENDWQMTLGCNPPGLVMCLQIESQCWDFSKTLPRTLWGTLIELQGTELNSFSILNHSQPRENSLCPEIAWTCRKNIQEPS